MSFLSDLLKSAITDLIKDKDFTNWIDQRIQAAIASGESTLMTEVEQIETELIGHIEGNTNKIISDAETRAGTIINDLTSTFTGGLNPIAGTMATIQKLLAGLPHFPSFG